MDWVKIGDRMKVLWVLACALFLSACGASAKQDSGDYWSDESYPASNDRMYEPAMHTGDEEAISGEYRSEQSDGPTETIDKRPDVDGAKVTPNGGKVINESKTFQPTAEELEKRLVKNAYLKITLKKEKDIPGRIEEVETITKGVDGYVSSKTERSIVSRVPNAKLDFVLDQIRELGKVVDEDISVVDVTARYVDLQLRIENLKRLKNRLQELVKQGQNVKEILEVEKELGRITGQLEGLEGQMRVMRNQTTYATVSVMFKKRVRPGPIGWVFYGIWSGVKWLFVWD